MIDTPLHCAVRAGNYNLVKTLIADGAPVDAMGVLGNTPLHTAVQAREAKMVQLLVARGADKDAKNSWGQTPLMLAAFMGTSGAVAEALLAAGADPSFQGRGGETPLRIAARMGHVLVLAILTMHEGVDVNDAGGLGGGTALHAAVTTKRADDVVIDILVAAGANTEARDKWGDTPLHFACSRLDVQTAVALLRHGADINARRGIMRGDTPLFEAARQAGERGAVEMVDLLLRWGADETITNSFGHTPADKAGKRYSNVTEVGGVERVRKLLANAPVARKAWRRRGLLVASRAQPQMVFLSASTQASGEWMDLMGRVLGLAEEGVFRTIVGYL